ncbi:MAG TPA: hypothetical protein VKB93_01070 [Thermoanaerobaculia bacterium]|nr:hypothetical protein [Thermoanaerobaculia bacterium]
MPRSCRAVCLFLVCAWGVAAGTLPPAASASAKYYCGAKDTTELPNVRYVATSGTDSGTCGASFQSPCATVQRGIANCTGEQCAVLVAFDEYKLSETLLLTGGVSVYGGCEMTDGPNELRSSLYGPDGAPAVTASRIVAPTTFQGFSVFAGAGRATSAGGTSIAFASILSSGMSLESVSLTAGVAARAPTDGKAGRQAPHADNGRDQSPGVSPPGGFASGGGGGGINGDGRDAEPGDTGYRAPGARRGTNSGRDGKPGRDGPCRGPGAPSPEVNGSISSAFTWAPGIGGAGQKGGFGGGGSGGRGGLGYRGGGGGAGGEGGGGGEGGTQGGASIGLLLVGGRLSYNGGVIRTGTGGGGSRGGEGGPRGVPGNGGEKGGGLAGKGGTGGLGGPGTGGAGGNGGPAFAVATAGTSDDDGMFLPKSVELYVGTGGSPGNGGPAPSPCARGMDGLAGVTAANQRLEIRK